jgi:hypothetical protein
MGKTSVQNVFEQAMRAVYSALTTLRGQPYDSLRTAIHDCLQGIAESCQDDTHPLYLRIDDLDGVIQHDRLGRFDEIGKDGWIAIDLWKAVPEAWDDPDIEVDLFTSAYYIAHAFAHEITHYQQHLAAWGKPLHLPPSMVRRAGIPDPYLARSTEIHAHAADAVRELMLAYDSPQAVQAALRTHQGITLAAKKSQALESFWSLHGGSEGGKTLYRAFLLHVLKGLEPQQPDNVPARRR